MATIEDIERIENELRLLPASNERDARFNLLKYLRVDKVNRGGGWVWLISNPCPGTRSRGCDTISCPLSGGKTRHLKVPINYGYIAKFLSC